MREEPPLASAPRLLGRLLFSALFAAALAQPTAEPSDHERGQQECDDHAHADERIGENHTDASPPSLRTASHGSGPRRIGLVPTARCRSPGALRKILDTTRSDDALSVGLNAALHTLSAWPVSGSPIGLPARGVTLAIPAVVLVLKAYSQRRLI